MLQEEHHGGNEQFKIALATMVSLASKGADILKSSKTATKRALLSLVFSNLEMRGAKVQYTLSEPFKSFENVCEYKEWLGYLDSNQGCRYQKPVPYRLAIPHYQKWLNGKLLNTKLKSKHKLSLVIIFCKVG